MPPRVDLPDQVGVVAYCDPARLELYLDNGFGFSITHEGGDVSLVLDPDPREDWDAFYLAQLRFLFEWQQQAGTQGDLMTMIQATFAHGLEQLAREVGVDFTAADVTTQIVEAQIALRLVLDRLGQDISPEDASAELRNMLSEGVSQQEAALAGTIRSNIADQLARSRHELSRQVAFRLRQPAFMRRLAGADSGTSSARSHARQRGARPRRRRAGASSRCRSPGSRLDDPPDDPDHDLVLRGGRR